MSLVLVFPGQGGQKVGMGRELYDGIGAAKETFESAGQILGYSISEKIFNGPAEELKKTEITQPAVFTVSAAALAALKSKMRDMKPAFVAGHSLGEYAAVYASGALDFENTLKLVAARGRIMAKISGGGMAVIMGLDDIKVKEICAAVEGIAEAVNFNSPGQVVIAGDKEGVEQASAAAKEAGAKRALPLAVSGPFHSSLMKPAQDEFAEFIKTIEFKRAEIPIVTNCRGEAVTEPEKIKQALIDQIASPVLWVDSINLMIKAGVDTFIECGPGQVVGGLIKRISPDAKTLSVADMVSLEAAVAELNG